MKDLIKKILKEEIQNDLSWVNDYVNQQDPLEPVKEFIYNVIKDSEPRQSTFFDDMVTYTDEDGNSFVITTVYSSRALLVQESIWKKCLSQTGCSLESFKRVFEEMFYLIYKEKVENVFIADF